MDILRRLGRYMRDREFRLATLKATALFCIGIILNTFGSIYATERASNYVSDLILSNTRVYHLDGLFVYGALFVIMFAFAILVRDPKTIPFTLASIGLFYLTRSVFISLTHLGPFPTHADLELGMLLNLVFGGGDYFFSGHTGAPFLLALLFWRDTILRYLFLISSGVLGVVVLLTHLHYSIDVLSAFFITYGIYHMALWLFPKEARLFHEGIPGLSGPQ
ncbi:hypothetical protein A2765_00980 [Candidatus Kaiserbacteria bacterium RIFCSPHIGHO2_01_FULL_56_24]|uniref:Sphingomyelin synthase-like domain-containing protein n=1 Tax=Candidatus Kaiserbacteria bacterium RIFCSPHIGHO2_01_FULL_56_24 TaxID=1798487 RepID=A0A1F6DFC7_9BACT|nr:MAG: hypothetical protein A2765_00980 [Candidatus Kaiserbacteria bacterium RIFCSPHIGHO2_01_FULL_56_24]